jgi:hypothetical protein
MTINSLGLLKPQLPHVTRLVDSLYINGFAFDLSDTGCGKMYCASAISREMRMPTVVICPKSIIPQWQRVLNLFGIKPIVLITYEKLARGNTQWMSWKNIQDPYFPNKHGVMRLVPVFKFPQNALIIMDEGHKCRGGDTSNSWMMVAFKLQKYTTLVSSATLATSPLDMRASGYLADLHKLYDFSTFCRLHGGKWTGRYGAVTWDSTDAEAIEAMRALNEYLFEARQCASRLTVRDMGDDFPETRISAEAYDLGPNSPQIQSVYLQMEQEIAELDDRTENYSQHIFAILIRARREAELLKVPTMVDKLIDLYAEGKSVAVFVNFTDTVNAMFERLPEKLQKLAGFVVGGQSDKDRQQAIDDFQSGKKRIIICNVAAGGVGVSLHDLTGEFPRASIISPTWSAFNLRQSLGRVWRLKGVTKSVQFIMYAAGCVEEDICRRVKFKLDNLSTLNDGELNESEQFFRAPSEIV